MKRVKRVINGEEVWVTLCPPSRRRAASSIQKPKFQRRSAGALHAAVESGNKILPEVEDG